MSDQTEAPRPAQRKRRFLDRAPSPGTVIGAGSMIVGNVRGSGAFLIAGEIRGDGDIDGHLSVAAQGAWHGRIRARSARVAGSVVGGLRVEDKLEILRTARITGSVSARSVAIANGAIVDGDVEVTSGGEVVRFEERRGD